MSITIKEKLEQWVRTLSRAEAQNLLNLLVDEHALADRGDFLQDVFVANYVNTNHNIQKALAATGVSYDTYSQWRKDPAFQAKIAFANQAIVAELFDKARQLALAGETDMLKFLLQAMDPEVYDSKYRAQVLANQGAVAAAMEGSKNFTMRELRELLINDPAQQFIDVTASSEPASLDAPSQDSDDGPI